MKSPVARYYEIEEQRGTIEATWRRNGCNIKKTAAELQMVRPTLKRHLRDWGVLAERPQVAATGMTVPQLVEAIENGFARCSTYEGIRGYWLGLRCATLEHADAAGL